MTISTPPTSERHQAAVPKHGDLLRVSAYDRAASLLVSLLVMIGLFVLILVVIWITNQVFTVATPPEMFLMEEGETLNPEGSANDINEPGIEELNLAEPEVQDTLAAVTDAVSSISTTLDAIEGAMATRGSGAGDNRKRGTGSLIPRWQRWEIRYLSTTLESYVKQLEFFGIELAAIGGGSPTIDYVTYQKGTPVVRSAPAGTQDERLYFVWQSGKFKDQDRALLSRAGINATGRIMCQFFSPQMENQLAVLENQQLGSRKLDDVRKTVFGVRPSGRQFEFYVIEMRWKR